MGAYGYGWPTADVTGEFYGVVKSWNGLKGFGFITSEVAQGDVFFSRNELPEEAREVQGTFLQGRQVTFVPQQGPDGRVKASSVAITAAQGQPIAGLIKSYSEKHGYGFVTSSSLTEDARFQSADLPQMMPGANLKGKLVLFEVQQLQDGKLRVTKIQYQSSKIAAEVAPGGCGGGGGGFGGGFGAPAAANLFINSLLTGQIDGVVKSFSEKNGYGFINIPGQPIDIKFGQSDLQGEVQSGQAVKFTPMMGGDGRLQAKDIQPGTGGGAGVKRAGGPTSMMDGGDRPGKQQRFGQPQQAVDPGVVGQYITGAVKSYIPSKGFGFISSPEVHGDIYFSKMMISPEMQDAELKGQEVTFELACAPDGKLRAANVTPA